MRRCYFWPGTLLCGDIAVFDQHVRGYEIKYFCQFYFLFGVLSSLAVCVYFACVCYLQYYCSLAIIPLFASEAVIAGHDNLFLLSPSSTLFLPGFLKGDWK